MNENKEKICMTPEELFTMEGYERFKAQMTIPEENREFFLGAYLNIVGTSLLL